MATHRDDRPRRLAIESHGVVVSIELGDLGLLPSVTELLPPGHTPGDPGRATVRLALNRAAAPAASDAAAPVALTLSQDGQELLDAASAEVALAALDARIRHAIATHSPEMVFIHAGVVGVNRRAVMLPGASYSGKSELVAALLRAGATYYSDEYAVLDSDGLVHPYPRWLSIRKRSAVAAKRVPASEFGAVTGVDPIPAAVIAFTRYRPGARWDPAVLTAATGVMRLLAHAGQVRTAPQRTLGTIGRIAEQATVLEGPRGEADETATMLIEALESPT